MLTPPSPHSTITHVVVRPNDMDADRHVSHAVYFNYLYPARLEHLRRLGISDVGNPQDANLCAFVENTCRYLAPASYGEVFILWTATHAVGKSRLQCVYHVWREREEMLIAVGHAGQVGLGETKHATPLPSAVRTALTTVLSPALSKPAAHTG